jgi:hypothetical protein
MSTTQTDLKTIDFESELPPTDGAHRTANGSDAGEEAEWTGPRCEKCAAPIKSDMVAVCRSCGWYGSLGTFVEVDPKWEGQGAPSQEVAPKSHVKVWVELVPWWGWVIIGSALAVIVESIIARLVTSEGDALRTYWSVTQLAIGAGAAIGAHVVNFLLQVAEDADVGLFDLILKPVKLWLRTFRRLPSRLWVVDAGAAGLASVAMSLLVIGGIPYERLWDWGFTPPAKQELMGAVMDRVKEMDDGRGADDLEQAVGDFAGNGEVDGNGKPKPTPPKPRKKADCVVVGYQVDKDGRLSSLVLGTAHLGRLVYAGNVAPKFDDEAQRKETLALLAKSRTHQRLLPIEVEAAWVKPTIACRVSFEERKRDGRLTELKWDAYLGRMKGQ